MYYNTIELKKKEWIYQMFKKISALLVALSVLLSFTLVASAYDIGSVTASVLNVRSGAGTDYAVIGQLVSGQTVHINDYTSNGWLKISYNNRDAYVASQYVSIRNNQTTSRGNETSRKEISSDGIVTENLNFRFKPSTDSAVIAVIPAKTKIFVNVDLGNGWAMVTFNGVIGYASLQYISYNLSNNVVSSLSAGQQVVEYAKQFLGKPYVYGGNGPNSFDCSGFTKFVYSKFGVSLNRVAADQINNGTYVDKASLLPGDLILFANTSNGSIGHVGIYVGNDQFIHASTNSYTVRIDNLSGYYSGVYHSSRRIFW